MALLNISERSEKKDVISSARCNLQLAKLPTNVLPLMKTIMYPVRLDFKTNLLLPLTARLRNRQFEAEISSKAVNRDKSKEFKGLQTSG
jgi:hypothetical protein